MNMIRKKNKVRKQRNCHARSKQRKLMLKLKNMHTRMIDKKAQKIAAATKTKGRTIQGRAMLHAIHISKVLSGHLFNKINRHGDPSAYIKPKKSSIAKRARKKNSRASRKKLAA